MDPVTVQFTLAVTELILTRGVPAALATLRDWEVDNPSVEDIKRLKSLCMNESRLIQCHCRGTLCGVTYFPALCATNRDAKRP